MLGLRVLCFCKGGVGGLACFWRFSDVFVRAWCVCVGVLRQSGVLKTSAAYASCLYRKQTEEEAAADMRMDEEDARGAGAAGDDGDDQEEEEGGDGRVPPPPPPPPPPGPPPASLTAEVSGNVTMLRNRLF